MSRGIVCLNVACPVRDFAYSPAIEWLVADLTRHDGIVCGASPFAWVKSANDPDADASGVPGSGKAHYQRRDWEAVYTFALPDRLPLAWSDNTAFGRPAKGARGGEHERSDAHNRDQWGAHVNGRSETTRAGMTTKRRRPGSVAGGAAAVCNPGNVIRCPSGGHKLGHRLAHASAAPMPVAVVERFVCWYAEPGGVVADPFLGSGTTIQAAREHGRRGIGCDIDDGMVAVAVRRLSGVTPGLFASNEECR